MASVIVPDEDRHENRSCDTCQRIGKSSGAVWWCKDCSDSLCEQCFTFHKVMKSSSKHQTVPIKEVTEEEIEASKVDINTNCELHPDKSMDLYCGTHKVFCCSLCTILSHKSCGSVVPLDDIAEKYQEKETFRTTQITKIASTVQIAIEEQEAILAEMDKDRASILAEVSNITRTAKEKLDALYSEFESTLQDKHTKAKHSQKAKLDAFREFKTNIEHFSHNIKIQRHFSSKESLIMTDKQKKTLSSQYQALINNLKNGTQVKLKLKIDPTMTLINENLSNVGQIEEETKPLTSREDVTAIEDIINTLDTHQLLATQAQYPVITSHNFHMTADVRLVKVMTYKDIGLKRSPSLFAGAYLTDGGLLLSEYNNKRLLKLNEDHKLEREIPVAECPSGISLSKTEKEVFVVCNHNSVHRYDIQSGREVAKPVRIESDACTIAVRDNNIITGHNGQVVQYDGKWNQMKTISTKSTHPSTTSSLGGSMFFHDDGNDVVTRNMSGIEMHRYCNKELSGVTSMCVDYKDNVYVVGGNSKNVHQISQDGENHRSLIKKFHKIKYPRAIVFHPTRPMFIVTSNCENVSFEMYELK